MDVGEDLYTDGLILVVLPRTTNHPRHPALEKLLLLQKKFKARNRGYGDC
jgi:hypothetical protein